MSQAKRYFVGGLLWTICFLGCAQKPPLFEDRGEVLVHRQSGVALPKNFPQWTLLPDSVQENLNPEIFLSESFEHRDDKLEVRPRASLFIMRVATSSNLKLIENRITPTLEGLKLIKTESIKLKNKHRVLISSYNHTQALSHTVGSGSKSVKSMPRLSYFATSEKGSKTVVWVTVNKDKKNQTEQAMDFIERALSPSPSHEEKGSTKKH